MSASVSSCVGMPESSSGVSGPSDWISVVLPPPPPQADNSARARMGDVKCVTHRHTAVILMRI